MTINLLKKSVSYPNFLSAIAYLHDMIAGHEAEGARAGWGVVGEEEATAKIVHPNKRGLRETEVKHSISGINLTADYFHVSHRIDLLKLAPDGRSAINGRCSSGNIQANVGEGNGLKNGLTERKEKAPRPISDTLSGRDTAVRAEQ